MYSPPGPASHGPSGGTATVAGRAKALAQARPKEMLGRAGPARLLLRIFSFLIYFVLIFTEILYRRKYLQK
jgi:hypothetical protein